MQWRSEMSDYESASFFERLKRGLEKCAGEHPGRTDAEVNYPAFPTPSRQPGESYCASKKLKMSQSVFAAALNVSTKLVQSWEQGLQARSRGTAPDRYAQQAA